MKLNIKKIAFAAVAAMLFAAPAFAQTYSKSTANSNGNFNVRSGVINSATAITNAPVFDSSAPLYLVVSGTSVGQAIVTPLLADGTPGGAPSQTISVNIVTPTVVSWTAPLPFTALRVSPVGSLTGVNTVTPKLIQSK